MCFKRRAAYLHLAARLLFDLVSVSWKRQKLFQAANGVETQVIDGKVEIENGNVPEDRAANTEESDTISPFHIPSMGVVCLCMKHSDGSGQRLNMLSFQSWGPSIFIVFMNTRKTVSLLAAQVAILLFCCSST